MIFKLSTLNTYTPNKKFLKVIYELINFCFDGSDNYVTSIRYGGKWVSNLSRYLILFNKKAFKITVTYLLDNCLFYFILDKNVPADHRCS